MGILKKRWAYWDAKQRNKKTFQDKERKRKEWHKCETDLTGRRTQTLPHWQDFGCQNSSRCSAIVKLSAFKKMEEITHSICLWEVTAIVVDFWIKYDWTWDCKEEMPLNVWPWVYCMDVFLSVHLFFSPWNAESSPNQAVVACHELNMAARSGVSLGEDRK